MPCGWEGNRRSGVALAMRHRLQWSIYLRAHGLRKGYEHPAYTSHGAWHTLPLPFYGFTGGQTSAMVKRLKLRPIEICLLLLLFLYPR